MMHISQKILHNIEKASATDIEAPNLHNDNFVDSTLHAKRDGLIHLPEYSIDSNEATSETPQFK